MNIATAVKNAWVASPSEPEVYDDGTRMIAELNRKLSDLDAGLNFITCKDRGVVLAFENDTMLLFDEDGELVATHSESDNYVGAKMVVQFFLESYDLSPHDPISVSQMSGTLKFIIE